MRAEDLRDFADRMVDVAAGLGEQVIMVGLSAGGIVTAWAAQHRPEIDKAVTISPSLSRKREKQNEPSCSLSVTS